jgi:heavy metal sensor kinase
MLVLTLTLSLFSIILYHYFQSRIISNFDSALSIKARGIATSINTYWEAEKLDAIQDGVKGYFLNKSNNINFEKIAKRWVEESTEDPVLLDVVVEIFDAKGKSIASTKNIPGKLEPEQNVLRSVLEGKYFIHDVLVEFFVTQTKESSLFRRIIIPVTENDRVAYAVLVASPLESVNEALYNLRLILFLLLPLTVVLTGIIGASFAVFTLRPVDRMITTIHQITAENLKLRISVPDTKDEIRRLADTFNEMLNRLELAFVSQRQFIEDLTHELKTPLSVIKGELEVTLKRVRSAKEYESVLLSNMEEVNRIIQIVEDLLMLARFDSKVISLEKKLIGLKPLLMNLVEDMNILADQKNISISFDSSGDYGIYGDAGKLKLLFQNIIDNAIKYTPETGKIIVNILKRESFVEIQIRDTGVGILEKDLPHIFDRFYRVDGSRSTTGFGLGLSIAKSIAEAHQGKILVKSVIQSGSIFSIFLPFSAQKIPSLKP